MNDMRKLIEAVEAIEEQNDYSDMGGAYTAASLYLKAERGETKPVIAKKLSELTGTDLNIAVLMIDAIDAYEDIRETF